MPYTRFLAPTALLLVGSLAGVPVAPPASAAPCNYAREVGALVTGGQAVKVVLEGTMVYVALQSDGCQVIDVSIPSSPTLIGSWNEMQVRDLAKSGDVLGVATQSGVSFLDISAPATPVTLGSVSSLGSGQGISLAGTRAYIACGTGGLRIVDYTAPDSPSLIGSATTAGYAYDVFVDGSRAYVAIESGVQIFDVSAPESPSLVGAISFTNADSRAVHLVGSILYVADGFNGIQAVDVSTPSAPLSLGAASVFGAAKDVYVLDNRLFAAAQGVEVFDTTDPTAPARLGSVHMPSGARGVVSDGSHVFVAAFNWGVRVVDVSPPNTPPIVQQVLDSQKEDITFAGPYAYVAGGYQGLEILDVSDPQNAFLVGAVNTPGRAREVDVQGDLAYVADNGALQIIDISDPTAPSIVGALTSPDYAARVDVQGAYAYVGNGISGTGSLLIVDVSIPSSPQLVTEFPLPAFPSSVIVDGSYAYVHAAGLQVIDISSVAAPTTVASVTCCSRVVKQGNILFGVGFGMFSVLDVSEPSFPVLLGSLGLPFAGNGISVEGSYAYAVTSEDVQIIDVSNPSAPTHVGSMDAQERAYRVGVHEGYVYTPTFYAGVSIFQVPCSSALAIPVGEKPNSHLASLDGIRPNPAFSATEVSFNLREASRVTLSVHDVAGRQVRILEDTTLPPGRYSRTWNGRDDTGRLTAPGLYILSLATPHSRDAVKLIRLR